MSILNKLKFNKKISSYKFTLLCALTGFFFILVLAIIYLAYGLNSRYTQQVVQSETSWIETYSQTFIKDVQIGNHSAVNKKLLILANERKYKAVRLTIGKKVFFQKEYARNKDDQTVHPIIFKLTSLFPLHTLKILVKDKHQTQWGEIEVLLDNYKTYGFITLSISKFLLQGSGLFLIALALSLLWAERHEKSISNISKYIEEVSKISSYDLNVGGLSIIPPVINIKELDYISKKFTNTFKDLIKTKQSLNDEKLKSIKSDLANQVAHDIRSPLAVLKFAISNITNIPENMRLMISGAAGRIENIAEDLLQKHRIKSITNISDDELRCEQIVSILKSIVGEKKFQYTNRKNTTISCSFEKESYNLFSKICQESLKRIISNIINNSIEAIGESIGIIHLSVGERNNKIFISISDNGPGIPATIKDKLFQEGTTFGKEHGNGFGLFHAKKTINSWNGQVLIKSRLGPGTAVEIELPKIHPPDWYLEKIVVSKDSDFIIIDDDSNIHSLWKHRFSNFNLNIKLQYFSSPDEFISWFSREKISKETIFLVDFEYIGFKKNGLDIIRETNIFENSILVSSRVNEKDFRSKINAHKIKLISKNLAGVIPIEVSHA